MIDPLIAVECWADKAFFAKLLMNEKLIRKEKNKPEVIKSVVERRKNSFAVGIIDADGMGIERFLKGRGIRKPKRIGDEIELITLENGHHHLIQLLPTEFEQWWMHFLNNCDERWLQRFGYGSEREFVQSCKSIEERLKKDERFQQLLQFTLKEYEKTDNRVRRIKRLLDSLILHKYDFDINNVNYE